MIEDIGKVVRITGDKALVTVEPGSACATCGLREIEGLTPGGKPVFEALNMAKANTGDKVKVRVESVAYVKASVFFYGIPISLLIIGALLGTYLAGKFNRSPDAMSALFGMGGLIVGILFLFLFHKRGAKKGYMPVIVEVIQ